MLSAGTSTESAGSYYVAIEDYLQAETHRKSMKAAINSIMKQKTLEL